jgi:hypothetical protein
MAMAKKRYSKKGSSEPAVYTVILGTEETSGGTYYCDLSQIASILNRRFYRQGINWAVAGFKLFSPSTGFFTISKLPTNWVTMNAWTKAFNAWNRQQKEALAESGGESAAAKFRDFKVFADVDHVTAGVGNNLLPLERINVPYQTAATGEWEMSQIVIPNAGAPGVTEERFLHMVGLNANGTVSRGVIEGYADSRAYPQSPDPVSPDLDSANNWLARMFDVGDNMPEILDNATDKNDNLPYDQDEYPGGSTNLPYLQTHDLCQLISYSSGVGNVGTQYLKGGQFPCGLIRFDWEPETSGNFVLQIDLVPGDHRGYLCEKM